VYTSRWSRRSPAVGSPWHEIAWRLRRAGGGKHCTVDNPQHPGRTYTTGSLLVALIVAAAFVFALLMGVHSFA
jgi:hypothetical protein